MAIRSACVRASFAGRFEALRLTQWFPSSPVRFLWEGPFLQELLSKSFSSRCLPIAGSSYSVWQSLSDCFLIQPPRLPTTASISFYSRNFLSSLEFFQPKSALTRLMRLTSTLSWFENNADASWQFGVIHESCSNDSQLWIPIVKNLHWRSEVTNCTVSNWTPKFGPNRRRIESRRRQGVTGVTGVKWFKWLDSNDWSNGALIDRDRQQWLIVGDYD